MSLQVAKLDELIALLAEKGVQLWADGDQLRVRAPKGVLTAELPDLLALHKHDLLRKLQERQSEAVDASLPRLTPHPEQRYEPFPLNDIQEAYWVGRSGDWTVVSGGTGFGLEHWLAAMRQAGTLQ